MAIFYVLGLDDILEKKQKDIIFKAAVNDEETSDPLLGDLSDYKEDEKNGTGSSSISMVIGSYHTGDKLSDSPLSFGPTEQDSVSIDARYKEAYMK